MHVRKTESLIHRESHHLNLLVQGKFDSGVPGSLFYQGLNPGQRSGAESDRYRTFHPELHMNEEERRALRDSLREARKQLSPAEQAAAAASLCELVLAQDFYSDARLVAFYQKIDGEIDPSPLMQQALRDGKRCFLPVVSKDDPEQLISFAPYDSDTRLTENHWGVEEPPLPGKQISPTNFDVVFVPLVGFDDNCFRLGMGKGFYDRTFSFKIFNRRSQPLLVGLAHECQFTEPFPIASWDVRLDAVITDKKIYRPETD